MKKLLMAVMLVLGMATNGWALQYNFSGTNGSLAASALFETGLNSLTVTLTNTSAADAQVPADILTAFFFDLGGATTLTPASATLGSGSTLHFVDPNLGPNVGGNWKYQSGLSGAPDGATSGISTVGFGIMGPNGNFGTPQVNLDGIDYGITSAGDNLATGNAAVTGGNPLVKNSVVFNFTGTGLTDTVNPLDIITNWSFQYGSALSEPTIPPQEIPEPATLMLVGSGLLGLGFFARRRTKG